MVQKIRIWGCQGLKRPGRTHFGRLSTAKGCVVGDDDANFDDNDGDDIDDDMDGNDGDDIDDDTDGDDGDDIDIDIDDTDGDDGDDIDTYVHEKLRDFV